MTAGAPIPIRHTFIAAALRNRRRVSWAPELDDSEGDSSVDGPLMRRLVLAEGLEDEIRVNCRGGDQAKTDGAMKHINRITDLWIALKAVSFDENDMLLLCHFFP